MLGSRRSHGHNKTISDFVYSSEGVKRKGQMSSMTDRYQAGILRLDGHKDCQIRRLHFRGTVTPGDGSNQKGGKLGTGYVNLRKQRKRQQRKVGREEEGSSLNHPEIAAFVLTLHDIPVINPILYLFDNQALLQAVKRWLGEKSMLVGAPDADILLEAIKEFRKRTTAGAVTFLVKVKAHQGEPANEETKIQVDKTISGN